MSDIALLLLKIGAVQMGDWKRIRFSLSCKANARVKPAKTGHGQHSSKFVVCVVLFVILIVLLLIKLFYVFFVCKCVLYHCHRVSIQLQLTIVSYHKTKAVSPVSLSIFLPMCVTLFQRDIEK
jgi:hypothetical protein